MLKPGMRADVNVFDAESVVECQPEILNDEVNVRDGVHTGARAGKVLRHRA